MNTEDTVPLHKFQCLVSHCKKQDEELARLRLEVNGLRYYALDVIWHWQPEGENYPNTLTCPILIQAADLRRILSSARYNDVTGAMTHIPSSRDDEPKRAVRSRKPTRRAVDARIKP